MSNGLVFVLHAEADAALAQTIANALAPHTAIPMTLAGKPDSATQFGIGATCIVVWTHLMAVQREARSVMNAVPNLSSNAVICCVNGAPLPQEFYNVRVQTAALDDAQLDIAPVLAAVEKVQHRMMQRGAYNASGRRQASPRLQSAGGGQAARTARGRPALLMRSAYGLVATFAVVGVVAPNISARALATGPEPANAPEPATPSFTSLPENIYQPRPAEEYEFALVPELHSQQDAATHARLAAVDDLLDAARANTDRQIAHLDAMSIEAGFVAHTNAPVRTPASAVRYEGTEATPRTVAEAAAAARRDAATSAPVFGIDGAATSDAPGALPTQIVAIGALEAPPAAAQGLMLLAPLTEALDAAAPLTLDAFDIDDVVVFERTADAFGE